MNPRALATWSAGALTMSLATANPVYRAIVLLAGANLLLARRREGAALRGFLIAAGTAAVTSTLLTVLLSHSGEHVLMELPEGIPVIGGALTAEALTYGLATGLGIAAAMLAVAPLTMVCQPHELVDALPPMLARSGAALGAALNLIPATARSAVEIRDAQRMRGWRARRIADWPLLAAPVVLTAVESSLTLAEAMEARGYGTQPRTHLSVAPWRWMDSLAAAVALAAAGALLGLRFAGLVPDWYPFPTLNAPLVSLPAVLCCAALALPAALPRR
jgi:energy-coupling factor transport system permease protein